MVDLYGQKRTRRELAASAGSFSQFAGVRLMTLGDGGERGDREHQRKDRETAHRNFTMAQLARPTSPRSITNAYPST